MDNRFITSHSVPTPPLDDHGRSLDGGRVAFESVSHEGDTMGPNLHTLNQSRPSAILATKSVVGKSVVNTEGQDLGKIEAIALDISNCCVAYGVLSFGGFLGIGKKLFAIPWPALTLDSEHQRYILDVDRERLKFAPGFDKDNWPPMADLQWATNIHYYYKAEPYWD